MDANSIPSAPAVFLQVGDINGTLELEGQLLLPQPTIESIEPPQIYDAGGAEIDIYGYSFGEQLEAEGFQAPWRDCLRLLSRASFDSERRGWPRNELLVSRRPATSGPNLNPTRGREPEAV